jgi:hypothetical protein
MYSMGQTAVASIPPAIHPADKASRGCLFFGFGLLLLLTGSASRGIGTCGEEGVATGLTVLIVGKKGRRFGSTSNRFSLLMIFRIGRELVHRRPSRPVKLAFGTVTLCFAASTSQTESEIFMVVNSAFETGAALKSSCEQFSMASHEVGTRFRWRVSKNVSTRKQKKVISRYYGRLHFANTVQYLNSLGLRPRSKR